MGPVASCRGNGDWSCPLRKRWLVYDAKQHGGLRLQTEALALDVLFTEMATTQTRANRVETSASGSETRSRMTSTHDEYVSTSVSLASRPQRLLEISGKTPVCNWWYGRPVTGSPVNIPSYPTTPQQAWKTCLWRTAQLHVKIIMTEA